MENLQIRAIEMPTVYGRENIEIGMVDHLWYQSSNIGPYRIVIWKISTDIKQYLMSWVSQNPIGCVQYRALV